MSSSRHNEEEIVCVAKTVDRKVQIGTKKRLTDAISYRPKDAKGVNHMDGE